jgi:predicted CxxxxCH...CXXCH cytochrome family protein
VGTGNSLPVPCAECHVPVTKLGQAGHYDSARPAEVSFGVLARTGGLAPAFTAGGCTNTWCHGAKLPGGSNKSPSWIDGAQSCTSCHGMPPADTSHAGATTTNCNACHPDTAGPGGTIAHPAKHVDGVVDTSAACDACHGKAGDPTPPLGLGGTTSSPAIGAHQAHKSPANSAPVACATCHLVPATYASPGHADTPPPAEVILAGRAALNGVTPSFAAASLTCQNTYCHGATLPGGKTSVTWSDATGAQSKCGACHGMPPADANHTAVTTPDTCNTCHKDSAGPNQTIVNKALHLDGVVQVSGAACDACHGSPPTATREDYVGGGGAHEIHVTTYKLECKICHGNNGGGATHNQGKGTIIAANVDMVFADVTYGGGTTTRNGQTSAVYTRATRTCAVGCHNPLPGNPADPANLANTHTWNQGAVACTACHERIGTAPPLNHAISTLGAAGCKECHDTTTGHTGGTVLLRDPDTTDAFVPVAGSWEWQCKTCHDSATATYMGGQSARNVSAYWLSSAHGTSGMPCVKCHTYHGSTGGPQLVDPVAAGCTATACHAAVLPAFAQAPGGVISHHRVEGGTDAITGKAITLSCSSCHNPHLAAKSPNAVINPDNRWVTSTTPKTKVFCKACHDGTPPAGVTGAPTVTQSGTDPTAFRTAEGHGGSHAGYNCQDCHTWHGNGGNTGIQRGRMLLPFINVKAFPYTGMSSCGTSGGARSCH